MCVCISNIYALYKRFICINVSYIDNRDLYVLFERELQCIKLATK